VTAGGADSPGDGAPGTAPGDAVQDFYPEDHAQCYGCGRLNPVGLHLRTFWEGDETVTRFTPEPFHLAMPGVVYGGLIASLIDCHSTGSAAATVYRAEGRGPDTEPPVRFVTASLHVDFLRPTPLGEPLEVRSPPGDIEGRKVTVRSELRARGAVCARGEVVAIRLRE